MAPSTSTETSRPAHTNGHVPDLESCIERVLGRHEAANLAGQHMVDNLDRLQSMNPQLSRFVTESCFGVKKAQSSIGYREWALLSIVMLIAIGDTTDQLEVYLGAALKNGCPEQEILDVISLTATYVGAPRAVNAMRRTAAHLKASRTQEMPSKFEERAVLLQDHESLIRDSHGEGPPMLLMHALSMDGSMWRDIYPQLASAGRVISYDIRGHGYARAAPLTKDLDHVANDARLLLDALGIEKADVYGQSYGGAVAQHFALNFPERCRSLSLITTASKNNPLWKTRASRAEADGMESLVAESVIRWFTPETIAKDPWCVRYAREGVRRARVEDWASAWRAMGVLDCIDRVGTIKVPMLVVAGKQDPSATPEMMQDIVKAASERAEYRELDPGTHMMALEQPDALAKELVAFRKRVDMASK